VQGEGDIINPWLQGAVCVSGASLGAAGTCGTGAGGGKHCDSTAHRKSHLNN